MKTTPAPTYNPNDYVHTIDFSPYREFENLELVIKSLCESEPSVGFRLKEGLDPDRRRLVNARNDDLDVVRDLLGVGHQEIKEKMAERKEYTEHCQLLESEFRAPIFEVFIKVVIALGLEFESIGVDVPQYQAAVVSIPADQVPTPPPRPTPPRQMHLPVWWTEATTRKQRLWPPILDGRASDREILMMPHEAAIATANAGTAQ